ncbi:MAG: rhomboid family intramembrane serine protease [Armatimonadota bacterium]|nr:rhomboid family intramembrane serine protease [Armatimonadota bacterium]
MIPLRDERRRGPFPLVTVTLIGLLVVIYLWDRDWSVLGQRYVFADLAVRPVNVIGALTGGIREPLLTLFTSIFLHANLMHLLSNVLFLWVFGPRVESAYGPMKFAFYYILWGVLASAVQIIVTPDSGIPMVGASGAIAGVMGSYLLLYPAAVIDTIVPPFFWIILDMPAWLLLGFWFLFQIFFAQPGVANWAHVGGFLVGMLAVILVRPKRPDRLRTSVP